MFVGHYGIRANVGSRRSAFDTSGHARRYVAFALRRYVRINFAEYYLLGEPMRLVAHLFRLRHGLG